MNRVAVIGSGGAGKSVFSIELGRRTGLPVVHLDRHFWSPGWIAMEDEPWSYPRTRRPEILRQLEALPATTQVVRLTSRRAMRSFLGNVPALSPSMSA